jgi:hypothetical protein
MTFKGTPDTDRRGAGRAHRDFDPVAYAWAEEQAAEAGIPAPIIHDDGSIQEWEPADYPQDYNAPYEGRSDDEYEADTLGDLVDPQDDTYGEEGTHGLPLIGLAAGAAMGAISKLTSDGGK